MTSPASAKLNLRMRTLHEEPLKTLPRKHSFDFLTDEPIEEQCEEGLDDKTNNQVESYIYLKKTGFLNIKIVSPTKEMEKLPEEVYFQHHGLWIHFPNLHQRQTHRQQALVDMDHRQYRSLTCQVTILCL